MTTFEEGMDPTDLVLERAAQFSAAVEQSVPLVDFLPEKVLEKHYPRTPTRAGASVRKPFTWWGPEGDRR